ncbi:hypothetical protein JS562_52470, partial [Agrobacterium sp. S2]|nr:hypothetical protein [Agrobacterium sp. S2]
MKLAIGKSMPGVLRALLSAKPATGRCKASENTAATGSNLRASTHLNKTQLPKVRNEQVTPQIATESSTRSDFKGNIRSQGASVPEAASSTARLKNEEDAGLQHVTMPIGGQPRKDCNRQIDAVCSKAHQAVDDQTKQHQRGFEVSEGGPGI